MAAEKPVIAFLFLIVASSAATARQLSPDFYKTSCPDAEDIVKKVNTRYITWVPNFAAALLRMHFHDCFVRGCDGSVLLKSPNNDAERNAVPNLTLRGFEVINAAKRAVEKKCPGVVSCADILALTARDAVALTDGPNWTVPLGRRDGRVSKASETISLPSPFSDIDGLKKNFAAQGLDTKDLVVLSGAHTLGYAHCNVVMNRLYNFSSVSDVDPTLNRKYSRFLKRRCKPNGRNWLLALDEGNDDDFNAHYYRQVAFRRGLLTSDAALLNDEETRAYVMLQSETDGSTFGKDFVEAMVKLSKIGVLSGKQGEIRRHCALVN